MSPVKRLRVLAGLACCAMLLSGCSSGQEKPYQPDYAHNVLVRTWTITRGTAAPMTLTVRSSPGDTKGTWRVTGIPKSTHALSGAYTIESSATAGDTIRVSGLPKQLQITGVPDVVGRVAQFVVPFYYGAKRSTAEIDMSYPTVAITTTSGKATVTTTAPW